MGKTVWKLRLIDPWQIGEHESWLADMAAKGLFLKKLGNHFARFTKNTPQQMNYRIEVTPNQLILDEQINLYEENGWDYVTSLQNFHVFSSPIERGATELHTDPAEQAFTLSQANKRLKINTIIVITATLFMIGTLSSLFFIDGVSTYTLVEGNFIHNIFVIILIVYLCYMSVKSMNSFKKLRKILSEGIPINHHAPWKKIYKVNLIILCSILSISIIGIVLPTIQIVKDERIALPEGEVNLPIVRLAAMEQNPNLQRDEYFTRDVDFANMINYHWSLIAPVQYETRESGIVTDENWEDDLAYKPSIFNTIYQLRFAFLADNLIDDLIERYRYEEDREAYVEIERADFDLLIVHESNEYSKDVFAAKGKTVVHVQYNGYTEIDVLLGEITSKLDDIN